MRLMVSRRTLAAVVSAGLLALPASAELQAWNGEAVLTAAQQLQTAVKDVRLKVRQDPAAQMPSKARARDDLLRTLKVLEQASTQLVARLEGGGGREDTQGIAQKIKSLVADVRTDWRRLVTTETTDAATEPAQRALDLLAPYYFEVAPPEAAPADGASAEG